MNDKYLNRIVINPKIMVGKPIIKGTRITVELILKLLGQGNTVQDILSNYPHLCSKDIYAAIDYARLIMQDEMVFPLTNKVYA